MSQHYNGESTLDETVPPTHYHHGNAAEEQPRHVLRELKDHGKDVPRQGNQNVALAGDGASVDRGKGAACVISSPKDTNASPVSGTPSQVSTTPLTSIDARGNVYPEGGLRAWLVVYGSFSGMTASFGLMNSIGTYQAWLSTHQLSQLDPSTIGWIFSIYTFLSFFGGVQFGPIFDAKGPRALMLAGTVCLVGGAFAIAESTSKSLSTKPRSSALSFHQDQLMESFTELWHFILSFSVGAGLGTSLVFTPAISCIAHFFLIKRAAATGLATTGGSVGGIVFPLMLQKLFPLVGFRWACRILGFIFLFQLIIANLLVRSRLPSPPKISSNSILPDWRIFKNLTFCLTTAGTFFVEWALFVPISYVSSYALAQGIDQTFSYQLLAILNVGSFFGRWAPGFVADQLGRFNTMIVTISLCMVSVFGLWLTCFASSHVVPQIIVFVLIFGFASGSNISLVPVCTGQLCDTEVFGRWYSSLYTVVSFGCLTGLPVAGSILSKAKGDYIGLIIFVGVCYAAGLACFVAARVGRVGWGLRKRY